MQYIIATPEGSAAVDLVPTPLSLATMQALVQGFIEAIYLPNDKVMIVNEEGRLKQLPVNQKASAIAGQTIFGHVLVMKQSLFQ